MEFLDGIKETPDKINYSKDITAILDKKDENIKDNPKARLIFTASVYMKMLLLMKNTTDEVGWHGVVERLDDITFKIVDIVVFPQIVTGANVEPNADEYAMWTMQLDDDTFNKMRFHGHSHVRMHINPSGVDIKYRDDMLPNLAEDDYYIFMIINYDEKRNIQIFDKAKNLVYDTEDVNVFVCDDQNNDIMAWVHTQEPLVKKRQYGSQTQSGHTTQTNTGNTTKDTDTQTTKDTETDKTGTIVIHTSEAPGDTAYWSNRMHLWYMKISSETKCIPPSPQKHPLLIQILKTILTLPVSNMKRKKNQQTPTKQT
jgi:hypothetical protein